jgi:hypothetical protein
VKFPVGGGTATVAYLIGQKYEFSGAFGITGSAEYVVIVASGILLKRIEPVM